MFTFDELVQNREMQELTPEQKQVVMRQIHQFAAHCQRIAVSDEYLLVEGGNLLYYAGLEYPTPALVVDGRLWLFNLSDDPESDDQADEVARHCRAALEG